ncbi:protein phosphatase 2C domain-containing protein [Polaribacter sp.]|uniref:protein phosphatase 2C domain-containing protein n=1 Tax=Polaribacter sp. TaxID=1920175 RepID=UPI003F6D4369
MITYWEKAPFTSACGSLQKKKSTTNLPFSVGGITRQGFDHIDYGISNQDSINIIIENKLIIGVLCDGCTNNHQDNITGFSQNQVGSNLLSQMVANLCYENMISRTNRRVNLRVFTKWLTRETKQRLKSITKSIKVQDSQRLPFICNTLLTTITGFIIREKEYFIFHYGDGIAQVNNKYFDLSSDSGKYLTFLEDSQKTNKPYFKIISKGRTKDLKHLYIASDGFQEGKILKHFSFYNILNKPGDKPGFIDFIPDFHANVMENYFDEEEIVKLWPSDDASLLLVRRIKNQ